jgi:hypothetical protein
MHGITFSRLGAVLMALALTGCAGSAADTAPSTSPTPFVAGDDFLCSGLPIEREALEARVPISDIDERGRIALSKAVWDDGSPLDLAPEDGWYVVTSTDDLVGVMRDVAVVPDLVSPGIEPDRELQTISWVEDASNLEPGWYGSSSGPCALTLDLGDRTVPGIEFQMPPDPKSEELRLLVTEESCNSGENAEGRVELLSLEETESQVRVILGVRPREGAQACPSHPATPFTVKLSEPLGDREVLHAGLVDPRPLAVSGPLVDVIADSSECEFIPLMLRATASTVTAGETVSVTTKPAHCPITDALAGELVLRFGSGDTPTGIRLEAASTQPVDVTVPPGLTGDGYIMLVPDQDCADGPGTADCHYPFATVTVESSP